MEPLFILALGVVSLMGQLHNYGIDAENPDLKDIRVRRDIEYQQYYPENKKEKATEYPEEIYDLKSLTVKDKVTESKDVLINKFSESINKIKEQRIDQYEKVIKKREVSKDVLIKQFNDNRNKIPRNKQNADALRKDEKVVKKREAFVPANEQYRHNDNNGDDFNPDTKFIETRNNQIANTFEKRAQADAHTFANRARGIENSAEGFAKDVVNMANNFANTKLPKFVPKNPSEQSGFQKRTFRTNGTDKTRTYSIRNAQGSVNTVVREVQPPREKSVITKYSPELNVTIISDVPVNTTSVGQKNNRKQVSGNEPKTNYGNGNTNRYDSRYNKENHNYDRTEIRNQHNNQQGNRFNIGQKPLYGNAGDRDRDRTDNNNADSSYYNGYNSGPKPNVNNPYNNNAHTNTNQDSTRGVNIDGGYSIVTSNSDNINRNSRTFEPTVKPFNTKDTGINIDDGTSRNPATTLRSTNDFNSRRNENPNNLDRKPVKPNYNHNTDTYISRSDHTIISEDDGTYFRVINGNTRQTKHYPNYSREEHTTFASTRNGNNGYVTPNYGSALTNKGNILLNNGYGTSYSGFSSSNSGYGRTNYDYGSPNNGRGSRNNGYGSSNNGRTSSGTRYGTSSGFVYTGQQPTYNYQLYPLNKGPVYVDPYLYYPNSYAIPNAAPTESILVDEYYYRKKRSYTNDAYAQMRRQMAAASQQIRQANKNYGTNYQDPYIYVNNNNNYKAPNNGNNNAANGYTNGATGYGANAYYNGANLYNNGASYYNTGANSFNNTNNNYYKAASTYGASGYNNRTNGTNIYNRSPYIHHNGSNVHINSPNHYYNVTNTYNNGRNGYNSERSAQYTLHGGQGYNMDTTKYHDLNTVTEPYNRPNNYNNQQNNYNNQPNNYNNQPNNYNNQPNNYNNQPNNYNNQPNNYNNQPNNYNNQPNNYNNQPDNYNNQQNYQNYNHAVVTDMKPLNNNTLFGYNITNSNYYPTPNNTYNGVNNYNITNGYRPYNGFNNSNNYYSPFNNSMLLANGTFISLNSTDLTVTTTEKIHQAQILLGSGCPGFLRSITIMGKKLCVPNEAKKVLESDESDD